MHLGQDVLLIGCVAYDRGDEHDGLLTPRSAASSFAIARVETTGSTLAWIFHELGRRPAMEKRMHAELDAALGGRPSDHQDLMHLSYTGRFITEVLRLYSPWMLMRRARERTRLGEVTVPAGAGVLFSPYALHRDPRWFPVPERRRFQYATVTRPSSGPQSSSGM